MTAEGETRRVSSRRRGFALLAPLSAVLLLAPVLFPAGAAAQQAPPATQAPPAAQAPAAAQPAGTGDVRFAGDAAVVLNYIKSDKAAQFEAVMAKVKESLEKSELPQRRQQAAGWRMFRSSERVGDGQVLYLWIIDPVVKGADYSVPKILSEAFPADVRRLYDQFVGAYARGKVTIEGSLIPSTGQ